ncbi:MAG: hypothetical protein ABR588_09530 [Sphingomicrobium sp.]
MTHKSRLALGLAASSALALSTAAFAEGKTDQARKAIAAAQARIEASNIVGAAGDAPRLHAQAVATLHLAEDELAHHAKEAAIHDATHASELADMALAASQRERNNQQQATTAEAEHQAANANARAADAQAAAAAAQADAAAARSAPPVIVQTPAAAPPPVIVQTPAPAPEPTSTTVTTTQTDRDATAAPPVVKHRVVHHRVAHRRPAAHTTKTTTTVTTGEH